MSTVELRPFARTRDGRTVQRAVLCNDRGMTASILSYGGILHTLEVPDRDGETANVVLGFADLGSYEASNTYFGALIGRYANRILDANFAVGDATYTLDRNDEFGTVHGGSGGFDRLVWDMEAIGSSEAVGVRLSTVSPDGDNGFPGNLTVEVAYELIRERNSLRVTYTATTDAPTVVNMTGHSYFNLAGEGAGSVLDHLLKVEADAFLPVTSQLVPTGEFAAVENTPFDFRESRLIGDRIRDNHEQLVLGRGYDHNYVLRKEYSANAFECAAELVEPISGRVLAVWTTEPGLDVYTGNFLDASLVGTSGRIYRQGDAIALEPEHFTDSPNRPEFPSVELYPGETYRSATEYQFGIVESEDVESEDVETGGAA
ncbi:hypothetical protein CH294_21325 [Rhodococcus sp. 14-2483-1-1]|uniref:aldose epimerase family protein n=1 Tax=Rhodococcus sp. 14-2483-1-1 TaxID=2023148 RepID=UPI000B9AB0A9|nr:aldose epimerase family protein [Rhodococcus sp. 14-2483-1-1]OZF30840.1 hypothetical protein CH294_21325 [Rhodococcus sp. 14-2483-1-1]